nr:MAG TPA_asm: hypothetical protein [Caudoviricetes sp.]
MTFSSPLQWTGIPLTELGAWAEAIETENHKAKT